MIRSLLFLSVVISVISTALAAPPKAVIEGADRSLSGQIVVLDASNSEGMPNSYSWEITPEVKGFRNLMLIDGGKRVITHSFPGVYDLELIVSNADGHSRAVRRLTIPGTPPAVPQPLPIPLPGPAPLPAPVIPVIPTPVPPTPPTPAPDPALTGLSLSVYTAASAVNSPTRVAEATCLANGCQALQSALAAGKYSGTPSAPATATQIGAAVVADMSATMDKCTTPAWNDARELFASKIDALWKNSQLKTVEDWKSTLSQIEQGLRRVK